MGTTYSSDCRSSAVSEFMRGVYWWRMPQLLEANVLGHEADLPGWYWTGEVQMNCMRQSIGQTL
ncbi:MAG: hypothetical protein EON56_05795, partial [Alphaproteobacteria bacterium]